MNKADFKLLLSKHDDEITQLKISTSHMLFLWKAVGVLSLLALGSYLTAQFGG